MDTVDKFIEGLRTSNPTKKSKEEEIRSKARAYRMLKELKALVDENIRLQKEHGDPYDSHYWDFEMWRHKWNKLLESDEKKD